MKNGKSKSGRSDTTSFLPIRFLRFLRHPLVLTSFVLIITASAVQVVTHLASAQRRLPAPTVPTRAPAQDDNKIGPEVAAQIQALITEKESRTPVQQKIDSQLLYQHKMAAGQSIAAGVPTLETGVSIDDNGDTEVDIRANVDDQLIAKLVEVNAKIIGTYPEYRTIAAKVPIDQLETIAAMNQVYFIQPNFHANVWKNSTDDRPIDLWQSNYGQLPFLNTRHVSTFAERAQRVRRFLQDNLPQVGSQQSQGDTTHQANTARSTLGPDGTGIKIGVLSNGVVSLAASQALGDLGPVTVLPGQTGTGDEGTAMLEIVHDLAPGAQLYFATANPLITAFASNIKDLRAAGCDIIIDDVFYFVETPFQDGQAPSIISNTNGGVVTQAVIDVTASGAMYFSSAGNQGNLDDSTSSCYQGDFVSAGASTAPLPLTGTVHDFGGGAQFDLIQTGSGNPIDLYWADPLGTASNDYDLFVVNSAGTALVSSSTNVQSGTQDPFEQTGTGNTTNNRVVVLKKTGSADRFFHITINANGAGRLGTATTGTTKGHSMALDAFSVGATPASAPGPFPGPFTAANVTETFSSDGPRRIFFTSNGTAITPGNFSSSGGVLRQKPDITAADRVSVTGVGGFPTTFSGTSAAAPHAGAIAALLKGSLPSPTNAQIRTALINTAIDIEAPGVDRDTGVGIIMPFPAMTSLGITPQAVISELGHTVSEVPGNSDGDGQLEKNEGGQLVVTGLKNIGVANATGVTATLSTTTPGVIIVSPGPVAYGSIATSASGVNGTPYQFFLGAAYTCGSPINFTLTINFTDPTARSQVYNFTVDLTTGFSVSDTMDATPPASTPAYTGATGTQTNRVTRDGRASTCNLPKPVVPGITAAATPRFDSFTFTASNSGCNVVTLTGGPTVGGGTQTFVVVYNGAFNPASIGTNYLADSGSSPAAGAFVSLSFNALAGNTYTVVVSEVPGAGASPPYTVTVNGASLTKCNAVVTAAGVSVGGRVTTQSGAGVSMAVVSLADQSGNVLTARTNQFGFFRFDDVEVGKAYTAIVTARRYTFSPQLFQLQDSLTGLNFVANQ